MSSTEATQATQASSPGFMNSIKSTLFGAPEAEAEAGAGAEVGAPEPEVGAVEARRRRGGGRRSSRKNRKSCRKDRKNRKNRKSRRGMYGGGGESLTQGQAFQEMTRNLHGGRRMRGGSVPMAFPFDDATLLQGSARSEAGVGQQDQFYKESQTAIPSNMRYPQAGGAFAPAPLSQADMLLPRGLSEQALNPQWHTEASTNPEIGRMAQAEANFRATNTTPGFNGPVNAYQTQAGGRRRSRKQRRASRKNRKNSRSSRKNSRKNSRK